MKLFSKEKLNSEMFFIFLLILIHLLNSLEEIIAAKPSKTPIQLLLEYGTKAHLNPEYEFEKAEGEVHMPLFTYKVTVGDIMATGL